MNDGVKILLERMETHPDEFYSNVTGKWAHIINTYKPYLNDEDTKFLEEGLSKLMQQRFIEEILGELVDPTEESNVKKLGNMFTKNRRAALAGTIPPISSITLEQTEHLRARLDALALGQTPIAGVTQTL
jgi:hypothetical protein